MLHITVKHHKFKRWVTFIFIFFLLFSETAPVAAIMTEAPQAVFSGTGDFDTVINNLNYTDVPVSNTWAKEAIYETGALKLYKSFNQPIFGLKSMLTKEEALSFVYILAGREADAQTEGEALNAARPVGQKKTDPLGVWMDGYLKLAADDGLISAQDFADSQVLASSTQQNTPLFNRYSPAQRQEVAYWLAMALGMSPVYGQQKIFNNYNDWRSADPEKIPYIEAVLQKRIMNGNASHNFNPAAALTREEAAQVARNAENELFPSLGYSRLSGVIEKITPADDQSIDKQVTTENIDIRNSGGRLHRIITLTVVSQTADKNENDGRDLPEGNTGLVVFKNGVLGDGSLLAPGDTIEYIAASEGTVKFINVLSNNGGAVYKAVHLTAADTGKSSVSIDRVVRTTWPGVDYVQLQSLLAEASQIPQVSYTCSSKVSVTIDGMPAGLLALKPDTMAVLTLVGNIVTEINVPAPVREEEPGTYSGIVEDNNPQLGYITLYKDDGTGASLPAGIDLITLRTYNYAPGSELTVSKDYRKAEPEDIIPGDSVFLKLDDHNRVISVSGVSNYTVKYGTVISKKPLSISVKYEDGSNQLFLINSGVVFINDGRVAGYDDLRDGDRIRLLLQQTLGDTVLKEISMEGSEHFISNIYKGTVVRLNTVSKEATVRNLEVFDRGEWNRTAVNAFTTVRLSDKVNLYDGGKSLDTATAARYYNGRDAYFAAENDYGGLECIVTLTYLKDGSAEVIFDDKVSSAKPGTDRFTLTGSYDDMNYGSGSIIVRDGRLVTGLSIADQDQAYVAASRDYNGSYFAGIVDLSERLAGSGLDIYRGRIKAIDGNRNFTLESYSRLDGTAWNYANTPKTLKITYDTRIFDDNGLANQRDFVGYGANSYVGRVVYAIADGADAVLVSTAPFGPDAGHIKGTVYDLPGLQTGEDGQPVQEPTGLDLTGVRVYNPTSYAWENNSDIRLNLLKNTVFLKGDSVILPSEIRKGQKVTVYQKGSNNTGDAYIVQVVE